MKEIGQKIRKIRKRKGMSQEDLAEEAGVNLRTIQRIENNETEPRSKTLQLICDVLEINLETILDYGKQENKNYLMFMHLSVLSSLLIPIGNIIIPLVLWLNKKDKVISSNEIGKNILNFQISWTILSSLLIVCLILFTFIPLGNWRIIFLIFLLIKSINVILPVIFAILTKKRETTVFYPSLIKFIS
ncbi:helix-turn-helix domain-containing protein [Aureivirga marina]|uniref:helix-turn-helix domain-containing protein n=1 Tax=Aureivirga marina TaxID=1182451 RepID=UPI0018CA4DD2|nr:helix-turn-helix domain-containing protein [Aureivirga marina]